VRFTDKVALVTGAADGIGQAIALKLSDEGARVAVNDLSLMAAEDLTEKIKDMGREALPVQADVSKPDEVERMYDQVLKAFNQVDILISNAGVRRDAPVQSMTEVQWDEVMDVHLKGCFNTARLAQKYMARRNYGKIVIIAAPVPSGFEGVGQINYAAANAGLAGLTRALALELGRHNINVNCVAPDFIVTRMTRESARREGLYLDDLKRAALARIPLRRLGTVEDVANVAAFLASDESGYVSGQVIMVKGGP